MLLLNDKTYRVLKFLAQIVLPALATLYMAVALTWGFPHPEQVVATLTAVDTFLGVVLGISSASYKNDENRFDGALMLEDNEDSTNLRLQSVDEHALLTKSEVTFKVNR